MTLQVTNADALNSLLSILDAAEERLAARDGKPTVQPKVATTEAGGENPGPSKGGRRESAGKAVDTDDMSPAVSLGRRLITGSSAEASRILDGQNPNELFVRADGSTTEYSTRAVSLLAVGFSLACKVSRLPFTNCIGRSTQDPSVLFIVIKTRQAEAAQKAVEVADATKR